MSRPTGPRCRSDGRCGASWRLLRAHCLSSEWKTQGKTRCNMQQWTQPSCPTTASSLALSISKKLSSRRVSMFLLEIIVFFIP